MFWNDQCVVLLYSLSVITSFNNGIGGCLIDQRHLYSENIHEPVELDQGVPAGDHGGSVQELGQTGHRSAAHLRQQEGVLQVGGEGVGEDILDEGTGGGEDEPVNLDVSPILGDQDDVCVLTCREVLEAQVGVLGTEKNGVGTGSGSWRQQ